MYKKVCCTCKVFFFLDKQTYCFFLLFSLPITALLALHDFIFSFSKLQMSGRASPLALAKFIYQLIQEAFVSFKRVLWSYSIQHKLKEQKSYLQFTSVLASITEPAHYSLQQRKKPKIVGYKIKSMRSRLVFLTEYGVSTPSGISSYVMTSCNMHAEERL